MPRLRPRLRRQLQLRGLQHARLRIRAAVHGRVQLRSQREVVWRYRAVATATGAAPRAAWATQRDVPRLWAQLRRELQLRNLHHDEVRQCWLVPRAVQQREECEVVRRGAGPTASAWSPRAASKQWHLPGVWVRVRCELQLREMQYEARL